MTAASTATSPAQTALPGLEPPLPGLCDLCRTEVADLFAHQDECPEAIALALHPATGWREYWLLEGDLHWQYFTRVLGYPVPRDETHWYTRNPTVPASYNGPGVRILAKTDGVWNADHGGLLGYGIYSTEAQARAAAVANLDAEVASIQRERAKLLARPPRRRAYRKLDEKRVLSPTGGAG